jgi:hypothetical protein
MNKAINSTRKCLFLLPFTSFDIDRSSAADYEILILKVQK